MISLLRGPLSILAISTLMVGCFNSSKDCDEVQDDIAEWSSKLTADKNEYTSIKSSYIAYVTPLRPSDADVDEIDTDMDRLDAVSKRLNQNLDEFFKEYPESRVECQLDGQSGAASIYGHETMKRIHGEIKSKKTMASLEDARAGVVDQQARVAAAAAPIGGGDNAPVGGGDNAPVAPVDSDVDLDSGAFAYPEGSIMKRDELYAAMDAATTDVEVAEAYIAWQTQFIDTGYWMLPHTSTMLREERLHINIRNMETDIELRRKMSAKDIVTDRDRNQYGLTDEKIAEQEAKLQELREELVEIQNS